MVSNLTNDDAFLFQLKNHSQRMLEMKDEILKQRQDEAQGNLEETFPCITINEVGYIFCLCTLQYYNSFKI